MHEITIRKANLSDLQHQRDIVMMMDAYSRDPMGDGKPLSPYATENLIPGLIAHPTTLVFLVYEGQVVCGIATCFRGFSTFAARPLLNLSDFYVVPRLRGKGIGIGLLDAIEKEAVALCCCKLTLEVQQNNQIAQTVYGRFGFKQAVYAADVDSDGGSIYMVKPL